MPCNIPRTNQWMYLFPHPLHPPKGSFPLRFVCVCKTKTKNALHPMSPILPLCFSFSRYWPGLTTLPFTIHSIMDTRRRLRSENPHQKKIIFHPSHPRWYKSLVYRDNQATPNRRHLNVRQHIHNNQGKNTKTLFVHRTPDRLLSVVFICPYDYADKNHKLVDLQSELSTTCQRGRMYKRTHVPLHERNGHHEASNISREHERLACLCHT